eukprot:TRINITY_DN3085_c1_g2_i1.p1 TRINITY_DN3085_c1_g2~~TRINITY_DN3085_c1_g2_i1.p1  ORF type:complete len:152 (+),score=60.21 TRINITY_DN3085_c1_g2_i1:61-456(+)
MSNTATSGEKIYENDLIYISPHQHELPWLKVYAKNLSFREFTDCDQQTRQEIWRAIEIIETEMRQYYKPTKINIASFGNVKPQVHWHVMARWDNDSYWPDPVWANKKREWSPSNLPDFSIFIAQLIQKLNQ